MNKKDKGNLSSFEEDLEEMRKILDDLESSELTLEEMIEKYRIGVELAKKCKKNLDEAETKIKKITS
mgnify:FL=1|tara:strand:- start:1601 stop:1801 length:201 start_codon:yes stop_codon:yes gene_type:complete